MTCDRDPQFDVEPAAILGDSSKAMCLALTKKKAARRPRRSGRDAPMSDRAAPKRRAARRARRSAEGAGPSVAARCSLLTSSRGIVTEWPRRYRRLDDPRAQAGERVYKRD